MQPRSNGAAGRMFPGTSWNACVSEQLSEQPRRRDSSRLLFMTCDSPAGSFCCFAVIYERFCSRSVAAEPPQSVSAILGYVERVSHLLPVAYVVHLVNPFAHGPSHCSRS